MQGLCGLLREVANRDQSKFSHGENPGAGNGSSFTGSSSMYLVFPTLANMPRSRWPESQARIPAVNSFGVGGQSISSEPVVSIYGTGGTWSVCFGAGTWQIGPFQTLVPGRLAGPSWYRFY